jgi:hypothetical protein
MTLTTDAPQTSPVSRVAAWGASASGVIGLVAAAFLIGADQLRAWRLASRAVVTLLFASHDVASIGQSLLLIPAAYTLSVFARTQPLSFHRANAVMAITALSAIALLQSLLFINVAPGTLYMFPQGLLGVWLIVVNRRLSNGFPPHVTRVGILAGVGLIMIGASLLTVVGYFGPGILSGTPPPDDPQARLVNRIAHINLDLGTFLGKPLYPIWVLLVARRLPWAPGGVHPDA